MNDDGMYETLREHGYEYKQILGKGGFSSVFLCRSVKYNLDFAVKRMTKNHMDEAEYEHLKNLNHPNIIKLYDKFNDSVSQYLVMEYCSNGTISQKGKLTQEKFVNYARQILEAISYCHSKGIAHRDIKPENIFLDQYDHCKLADFGMAKFFELDSKSSEKCGSYMYIAPEMLHCNEICPFKADIWSLGITFFVMATGQYPFPHKSREELKQLIFNGEIQYFKFDINQKIQFLVSKMANKDLTKRLTADKILDLPLFAKKKVAPSLKGYRTQSSLSLKNPMPVPNQPRQVNDIKSYKSIVTNNKIQRVNGRLQNSKTFNE